MIDTDISYHPNMLVLIAEKSVFSWSCITRSFGPSEGVLELSWTCRACLGRFKRAIDHAEDGAI